MDDDPSRITQGITDAFNPVGDGADQIRSAAIVLMDPVTDQALGVVVDLVKSEVTRGQSLGNGTQP